MGVGIGISVGASVETDEGWDVGEQAKVSKTNEVINKPNKYFFN